MTNQDIFLFAGVVILFFISVWGYDNQLDNTEFHCWLDNDDANKNNKFKCENVNFVWVNDPPKELMKDEPFTVEYKLRFDEDGGYEKFLGWLIENDWMDYANGNVTTAKEFCAAECGDEGNADADNCCVHHINVHSCLENAILAQDDVCGPWILPSGSVFTHTSGMATPIKKWTSEVVLPTEGTNIIIAHIRVGSIQMALSWEMIVYSPANCGDRYCDKRTEDCETCPIDCCPRLKHEILIVIIVMSCLLVLALILIPTVWYYQKEKFLYDKTWIIDWEKHPLIAS